MSLPTANDFSCPYQLWKARDTRLGRIVAIKMVKEQHSERFKQEARSMGNDGFQNQTPY
jgi:hypothetical protein